MTPTPAEIYKAVLEGAEYERLDTLHKLSVEQARFLGREAAFRTKDIIIQYEVVKADNAKLTKQNAALLEALKLTLMNAKAPEATDWSAVVQRLERAIAQAEGGA